MKVPETTITYNVEANLSIPSEGCAPIVKIEMTPKDGGCLIYGFGADGNMACIEVRGIQERIELPFAKSKVYVKYLHNMKSVQISTLGWRHLRLES